MTLEELSQLALSLVQSEQAVIEAEERLKELKEAARLLREETLPCAMQELGLSELKLDTGESISIKSEVFASIPNDKKEAAFRWLREQGLDGVIKTQVAVNLGKGEIELAESLKGEFDARGFASSIGASIHPQTLKALLKEQLAKGVNVPLDLFGARSTFIAKVVKK